MTAGTTKMDHYEIAIIGYGPVGATAANLFGRDGLKTVVIERQPEIYALPRAIGFDHEIMRIFQSAGLAEAVEPATAPLRPTRYLGAKRQVIRRFDRVPEPFPFGWNPNYSFDQPRLEAALRAGAEARESVDVLLCHDVTAVTPDEAGVTLTVQDLNAGKTRSIRADFVVACDGANSPTRDQLGFGIEDLDFDEQWIVLDVYAKDVDKLPQFNLQICDPTRPSTFVVGPHNHRRWEMMLMPGETAADIDRPEKIYELLSEWGTPDDFEVRRSAVYRFFARVAAEWRRGRVLLAGDAAHQTPPFIGQGMCQGIRDVANLCWKLKGVLRDGLDDALLDTYGPERKPHVITTTSRTKELGLEICMLDREKAAERDRLLETELDAGGKPTSRQSLIPGLEAGVLDLDDDGRPREPAGTLFPQPKVRTADGGTALLDDIVTPGILIVFGPGATGAEFGDKRIAEIEMLGGEVLAVRPQGAASGGAGRLRVVEELDGLLSAYFEQYGATAFIVRPDRYIFGMAKTVVELNRQLDSLAAFLGKRDAQLTSAAQ